MGRLEDIRSRVGEIAEQWLDAPRDRTGEWLDELRGLEVEVNGLDHADADELASRIRELTGTIENLNGT